MSVYDFLEVFLIYMYVLRKTDLNVIGLLNVYVLGICASPLGLEDGRVHYGQLTSSSSRENNPADAGRLNVVPNV